MHLWLLIYAVYPNQYINGHTVYNNEVSVCRRFGLSTFRSVDVLVCRRFGLSTFWSVDVLVCRRFGLSTFRFVDVLTSYLSKYTTTNISESQFNRCITANLFNVPHYHLHGIWYCESGPHVHDLFWWSLVTHRFYSMLPIYPTGRVKTVFLKTQTYKLLNLHVCQYRKRTFLLVSSTSVPREFRMFRRSY